MVQADFAQEVLKHSERVWEAVGEVYLLRVVFELLAIFLAPLEVVLEGEH